MAKKISPLLPSTDALLQQFGERLRLARLRRGLSAKQVCERAGMAVMTLRGLERGGSGVTVGAYLSVMQVLGIEQDLQLLAQADSIGRSLQDSRLPTPRAANKTTGEKKRTALKADHAEMARRTGVGSAADQLGKELERDYSEMARRAGDGRAVDQLRKPLGPNYAEMARLAGVGAAEEASKVLGMSLADMARRTGVGSAVDQLRKPLGPDYAEMARLAGVGAAEEASKVLGMSLADMARRTGVGSAADQLRKELERDYSEMARRAGDGRALDQLRKEQEAAKAVGTDWLNSGQLISSDMLAQLITPSKKEK